MIRKDFIMPVANNRAVSNRILVCSFRGTPNWHIFVVYAPHAFIDDLIKTAFWILLVSIWSECKSEELRLICGDFNAKLLERPYHFERAIGDNILRPIDLTWDNIPEHIQDKQARFLRFASEQDVWVANTNFVKSTIKAVTHRHLGSVQSLEDTHAGAADQIDFILTTQRWKNTVQDAESKAIDSFGSDHFPVIASVSQIRETTCL